MGRRVMRSGSEARGATVVVTSLDQAPNAVESVNSQLRRVLKPKGSFPSDEAVLKMLYLALQHAKNSWKAPRFWAQSLSYFSIMFGDRFPV